MKMRNNLFGILLAVLAVIMGTACSRDTDKIELQLRLQQGDSNNLRIITDQKISQTMEGHHQDTTQTISMGIIYNVENVAPNKMASVKVTYHSVFFKQDGMMGKIEYDSSNPPAEIPPAVMGFAALVGQNFSMVISPKGDVKDIQGTNAMLKNIIEQLNLPAGPTKSTMEKNMRDQFGQQALKESMENLMAIYPDRAVGIGDSWTKKVVISKVFPMILDNVWKLKARKKGLAIIEVRSSVKPNTDAAPIKMGNMNLSYNISGDQKGTIELQEATGWIKRGKLTQQLSGQVKMEGNTKVPEGKSWPISMVSNINLDQFEK